MAESLFVLDVGDTLDIEGIILIFIAHKAGNWDLLVVALYVDIIILYFFYLVEWDC